MSNTRVQQIGKLAFKDEVAKAWNEFVDECVSDPQKMFSLERICEYASDYHFESDLINEYFAGLSKLSCDDCLAELFKKATDLVNELGNYNYFNNQCKIDSWAARVDDWKKFKKYDELSQDYINDVTKLVNNIALQKVMSLGAKKAILQQVRSLADMMNQTVISLRNSDDYYGYDAKHVKRVAKLLDPMHEMMRQWVNTIPGYVIEEWKQQVSENRYMCRSSMLSEIEARYKKLYYEAIAFNCSHKQLKSSGSFSPESAAVGAVCSFDRQFVERKNSLTLEDLRGLMLQNILNSVSINEEVSRIRNTLAPENMAPLINAINANSSAKLFSVNHDFPRTTIEFVTPISNASSKLILEYNAQANSYSMQWKFFGKNAGDRMSSLEKLVKYDGMLRGASLPYEPAYDENKYELTAIWNFGNGSVEAIAASIKDLISRYKEIVKNKGLSSNCSNSLFEISMKKFFELDKGVQERCINAMDADAKKQLNIKMNKHASSSDKAKYVKQCPYLIDVILADKSSLCSSTLKDILDSNPAFYVFEKMVTKFGLDYVVKGSSCSSCSSHTLCEKMIDMYSSKEVLEYLAKKQPNLSSHVNLMHHIFKHNMNLDQNLVDMLVKLGAPVSLSGLSYIPKQNVAGYLALIHAKLAAMNDADFSNWLLSEIKNGSLADDSLSEMLKRYSDKIDYSNSKLVEALIKNGESTVVMNLLDTKVPDLLNSTKNLYLAALENKKPDPKMFVLLKNLNAPVMANSMDILLKGLSKLYLKTNDSAYFDFMENTFLQANAKTYTLAILDILKNGSESTEAVLGLVQKTLQYLDLNAKVVKTPLLEHLYNKVNELGHSSEYLNTVLGSDQVDLTARPGMMADAIARSSNGFVMYLLSHGTNFDACSDINFKHLTNSNENRELLGQLLQKLSPQKLTQVMRANANSGSKTFFYDMLQKFEKVIDFTDPVLAALQQKRSAASVSAMSFMSGANAQTSTQPVAQAFPAAKI
ncbi:MAG TPA: hypothetical protein VL360_05745 [Gammaproteobacteria bacterium]|nr:hypothetical protein [Gammaproteobacteria bacterium]